jgi:hypothetical protein
VTSVNLIPKKMLYLDYLLVDLLVDLSMGLSMGLVDLVDE